MFAKVPTEYQPRIVDIYPLKGMTLPTSEHFHSFFSQFGPILEVYQWTASKKSNVDHAYMVFKADDAVPALKKYWSKTTSGYWKESCKIVSGVPKAPSELVERLSALPSTSYAETSKRSGDEETTGEQPQAKKQRLVEEPESSESISPADFIPINTPDDASTLQSESHAVMLKREAHSPRISPTPPALAFAKQAAILAARTRKRNHEARVANGHLTEVERLKAELDEIRAENELVKAERDEVAAERDAAIESNQKAQRELQELKDSVKERDQRTDKILRLVTASLQSLHGGSVEAEV